VIRAAIAHVCFIDGNSGDWSGPPTRSSEAGLLIDEIIDDQRVYSRGASKFDTRVRADIARPSCDQYLLHVGILADDSGR